MVYTEDTNREDSLLLLRLVSSCLVSRNYSCGINRILNSAELVLTGILMPLSKGRHQETILIFCLLRCVHISDIGVGYISTMLALSSLFLRWCALIRDFGLQHICGMRNIRILSVAGAIVTISEIICALLGYYPPVLKLCE